MNELRDNRRVVVITGGSDGIGSAAARSLARRGDQVILIGRSPVKTREAAAEIGAEGHIADFADLGQVRELAAVLGRRHPRIDVLVKNPPYRAWLDLLSRYRVIVADIPHAERRT